MPKKGPFCGVVFSKYGLIRLFLNDDTVRIIASTQRYVYGAASFDLRIYFRFFSSRINYDCLQETTRRILCTLFIFKLFSWPEQNELCWAPIKDDYRGNNSPGVPNLPLEFSFRKKTSLRHRFLVVWGSLREFLDSKISVKSSPYAAGHSQKADQRKYCFSLIYHRPARSRESKTSTLDSPHSTVGKTLLVHGWLSMPMVIGTTDYVDASNIRSCFLIG